MKNVKVATANIRLKDLFFKWVELTRPFHKLTPGQQKVLALLLYHHYQYKQEITNPKIVWKTLFDYETKMNMMEDLDMNNPGFSNIIHLLRKRGIVKGNVINPLYIPSIEPKAKNFKIIFNFNIVDA